MSYRVPATLISKRLDRLTELTAKGHTITAYHRGIPVFKIVPADDKGDVHSIDQELEPPELEPETPRIVKSRLSGRKPAASSRMPSIGAKGEIPAKLIEALPSYQQLKRVRGLQTNDALTDEEIMREWIGLYPEELKTLYPPPTPAT